MLTQPDIQVMPSGGTQFPTTTQRKRPEAREALQRAEKIRAGMVSYHKTRELIIEAWHARDWSTLGYDSWDSYINGEFDSLLVKLTTKERRESVEAFRLEGMSQRAIANSVGASQSTVQRDLASIESYESTLPDTLPNKVTTTAGQSYPSIARRSGSRDSANSPRRGAWPGGAACYPSSARSISHVPRRWQVTRRLGTAIRRRSWRPCSG